MPPSDRFEDATMLARRIGADETDARELLAAAVSRMDEFEPLLNAIVSRLDDRASDLLDKSGVADGPFAGVPFLRKDLGIAAAGEPLYLGNAALRAADYRPTWTSALTARFARLGFVTVGTTNTPELGAQTTTQPLSTGPTRNPWDLARSASGSSGGSAAAVAAGYVPVAHANDYLGSTRLPAAWNGLYGLKPSRGRVPLGPGSVSPMSSEAVVTRSVRDMAVVLDGIAGGAPGELWVAPPPVRSYTAVALEAADGRLRRLRIGVPLPGSGHNPLDPAIATALEACADLLDRMGHFVSRVGPSALDEDPDRLPDFTAPSDYLRRRRVLENLLGRAVGIDDMEPFLWVMSERESETADDYRRREQYRQEWSARVTSWWERDGMDILVTPTIDRFPETIADLEMSSDPERYYSDHIAGHVAYTAAFNMTGQPALAIPFDLPGLDGVPPSLQLIGGPFRDDDVLALAAAIEAAHPFIRHPPLR